MAIENGKSDTKGIIPAHYSDDGNQYVELADSDGDKLEIVNGAVKDIPLSSGPVVITGLNNATLSAGTINGQDIDFSTYRHLTVRYVIGSGTGTLQLKVQYKGVDGNYYDDADLAQASSVASGSGKAFDGYFVNYSTIRVVATVTGSLTGVTCVISMKS